MNKERIFTEVINAQDSTAYYHKKSAEYYKAHGCGAYFDPREGMSGDRLALYHAYERDSKDQEKVYLLLEVCGFDREQVERFYIASRFLRRWFERTEWQFCPSRELIDRLWKFVEG